MSANSPLSTAPSPSPILNSQLSILNSQLSILNSQLIPPGYKQTEVGVIPEDWDIAQLTTIADVRDGTHESPKYTKTGVAFVTSKNILAGRVDFEDITFISEEDARLVNRRSKVDRGDILLSMIGTVGNAAFVDFEPKFCIKNVALIKPVSSQIESRFLIQIVRSESYGRYIDNKLDGGIQKFLSLGMLRGLDVPLPPTKAEQRAIAEALSDADELVESLEQLIAKKRGIKQATMQALLTPPAAKEMENGKLKIENGNSSHSQLSTLPSPLTLLETHSQFSILNSPLTTRLPGFSGKWEVKKIGELLKVCHGRSQHAVEDPNGEYPILGTGGCMGFARSYIYNKPSVLIGRKGTINKPKYMDSPFWSVDTLFYSIVSESSNAKFMFYKLCMIDWMQYNEASGVPSLNAHTIEAIEIAVPPLAEQTAIAEVLSDMDTEIAVLEQRRDKTRAIKQGMMQELLTGKIRLVN